jgi:flagellar biosynthetic protein FlhB
MPQDAGEKTERATPKKRRDAREKGQILKSQELSTSFCCIAICAFMQVWLPTYIDMMSGVFTDYLNPDYILTETAQIGIPTMQRVLTTGMLSIARIAGPVLIAALLIGVGINLLQVGFLFTTKTLPPKLERISPLKGFKRIFSMQTLITLVISVAKIALLVYIFYGDFSELIGKFPTLLGTDLAISFINILRTAFQIALKMSLFMGIVGAADYLYQWWKFERDMRMTKQEVKDEYKTTEGDPQIKSRIRQKQRQMSAMRMMDAVPSADVVITNPTHYAVAVKYEEGVSSAPVVVAKGQDYMARKIREKAREHGIQLVENKELAHTLFALCEVGQEIPPDLYQAVADILVFVFRHRQRQKYAGRKAVGS